jgi:hypothetical protein
MPDKVEKYAHGHDIAAVCMHRNKGTFCLSATGNQMKVQQNSRGYASKPAEKQQPVKAVILFHGKPPINSLT